MKGSYLKSKWMKLLTVVTISGTIVASCGLTNNVYASTDSSTSERIYSGMPGRDDLKVEPLSIIDDVDGASVEEILSVRYIPELSEIPHLRNQNAFGTCYSFATIGAVEANAIKKSLSENAIDGSELALAYFTSHTVNDPLGGGEGDSNKYNPEVLIQTEKNGNVSGVESGNPCFTAPVIATWAGVTDEKKVPYTGTWEDLKKPVHVDEEHAYDDILHVDGWYSTRVGITYSSDYEEFIANRNTLKSMIREFGGATLAYGASDKYLASDGHSYYNHVDKGLNHFVTVIEWDDDYDKNNFDYDYARPEGNGAWLCKNSWSGDDYVGTSVADNLGESKLFYISYYDTSVVDAYAFDVELHDNYDHNYQYDLAADSEYIENEETITVANVFDVHGNEGGTELLKAVSFETNGSTNQNYEIKIYKDPDLSNNDLGDLMSEATTTGTTTYCGYYTVPLENSVLFDQDDTFAVVITFTKENDYSGVSAEGSSYLHNPSYWFVSEIGMKENTSYVYDGDEGWFDLYKQYIASGRKYGNLKIKAFTIDADYTETLKAIDITHKDGVIPPRVGTDIPKTDFNVKKTITRKDISSSVETDVEEDITYNEYKNLTLEPATVPLDARDTLSVKVTYKQGEYEKVETIEIDINNEPEPTPVPEAQSEEESRTYKLYYDDSPITYTGNAVKVPVRLCYGDEVLSEKKDYTVSYRNNINAAEKSSDKAPYLIVKGKGAHAVSYKLKFDINQKNLADDDIKTTPIALISGNKIPERPVPAITYGKKKLTKKDMKLRYLDGNKNPISGNKLPADATGLYYVKVSGQNNYTGSIDIPICIGNSLMSKARVTLYADGTKTKSAKSFSYTGEQIKPVMTVTAKIDGVTKELVEGVDFECIYSENVEIGTATVSILGKLEKGFAGEKRVTFKITGEAINKVAKLSVAPAQNFVYDGNAKALKYSIVRNDNNTELREGIDYTVISSNNINKGNAKLTIKGKGKYSGSINVKYKINAATENLVNAIIQRSEYGYTKDGVTPKPLVTYGDMKLIEGRDYTLSYKNNKKVADKADANASACVVKFKGNYSGTKTLNFTIVNKDLKQIDAYVTPLLNVNSTVADAVVILTDTNGKQLKVGVDYKVEGYFIDKACTIALETDKKVCEKDGIDRIYVKLKGEGYYSGTTVAECKVGGWKVVDGIRKYYWVDIADIKIDLNDIEYAGNKTEPAIEDLIKKATFSYDVYDEDYDEYIHMSKDITNALGSCCKIIRFTNNSKKGIATVVIEGTSNVAGRRTLKFKIVENKKGF